MIVRREADGLLLVAQVDHAALTGELAALVADAPGPRAPFIAAARMHDNGWREADESPLLNAATGEPHSYHDMPDAPYRELWARGIQRAIALDPYVGLLVSLHGTRFFAHPENEEDIAFHDAHRAREDELLRALGLGGSWRALPAIVRWQQQHIAFLDTVSLHLCDPAPPPLPSVDGARFDLERNGVGWTLDPWPFMRERIDLRIEGALLPKARYADEGDLRRDLARATRRSFDVMLTPR